MDILKSKEYRLIFNFREREIAINKKALQRLEKHYHDEAYEQEDTSSYWLCIGKMQLLGDLLKLMEE